MQTLEVIQELLTPSTCDGTNTTFVSSQTMSSNVYLIVDGIFYAPSDTTYPFSYSGTTLTTGFTGLSGQVLAAWYETT